MSKLTPIKAIRAKCLDCCGGQPYEVRLCTVVNFPLYAYRMGHRPKEGSYTTESTRIDKSSPTKGFQAKETMS